MFIILDMLAQGKRIAYFAPNTGRFTNIWDKLNNTLADLAKQGFLTINNSKHEIKMREGANRGYCRFWSLEDREAGRSEYYDWVIIDEAAFAPHLEYTWMHAIRATLVDTQGCALIMSTPHGTDNFFYELSLKKGDEWYYHHAPTSSNTYISEAELESIKADMPDIVYAIEYDAKFIDLSINDFFYSRGSIVTAPTEIKPEYPLWFSFDFNVNPCSVLISQKIDTHLSLGGGCYFHDELQVQGTTRELCKFLKATAYYEHPSGFLITGDAAGRGTDTTADVLHNNYDIIMDLLEVSEHQLINTRGTNALHEWSRNVCNTAFHNQFVTMNASMKILPDEIRKAQPTANGKLKKDRDKFKMDMVDAMRYQMNAWFPEGIPDIRNYKQLLTNVSEH